MSGESRSCCRTNASPASLTEEERSHNKMVNSIRARVKHATRRVKRHASVANLYTGQEEFGYDFGIAAGLANFHLMWQDIMDGSYELG